MANVWNHTLDLADIWNDHDTPFEQRRDEIVKRFREAPFYRGDLVLSYLVEDLAGSGSIADFDRHMEYLYMWADREHVRVWIETSKLPTRSPGE